MGERIDGENGNERGGVDRRNSTVAKVPAPAFVEAGRDLPTADVAVAVAAMEGGVMGNGGAVLAAGGAVDEETWGGEGEEEETPTELRASRRAGDIDRALTSLKVRSVHHAPRCAMWIHVWIHALGRGLRVLRGSYS
jgi:hypothetical protein